MQMKREKERMEASPEKIEFFHNQKLAIKERLEKLEKHSRKLFDSQTRIKTLMLAIDEYLLHFTQLALVGERSENTLEKWGGRKKRYLEFLNYRFKISDIPLAKLEFKFFGRSKNLYHSSPQLRGKHGHKICPMH